MAKEYTYNGEESVPTEEEGLVDTFSFDDVTAHVVRSASTETYLALNPPEAIPYLHTNKNTANADVLAFISRNLQDVRDMRTDMLRRFKKSSSKNCKYKTGEVAYVLGRPFMIRVLPLAQGGKMRHAARGRAQTNVRVNFELSLVELHVFSAGNYDQRKDTFMSWAGPILERNVVTLVRTGLERAGREDMAIAKARIVPMHNQLVRYRPESSLMQVSDDLVGYPAQVVLYVCMKELAATHFSDIENEQREFIEHTCPEWGEAQAILDDAKSVYRLQT